MNPIMDLKKLRARQELHFKPNHKTRINSMIAINICGDFKFKRHIFEVT